VSKIRIEDDGSYLSVNEEGQETRLEKAKITLNDCLACSGCIKNVHVYNLIKVMLYYTYYC
jgi:iron only hydrogenase large subunit-like protein